MIMGRIPLQLLLLISMTGVCISFTPPKVIVIGGGIGGLAVAGRLAKHANVKILEKNHHVGGRCGSFFLNGFRHERGPSLLLLPHVYRNVFLESAGKTPEDFGLQMKRCIPAYKVFFDDGDSIDLGFSRDAETGLLTKLEQTSRETMNHYEEHGSQKWDAYLQACESYLDAGLPNFIQEKLDLSSLPNFLKESLKDSAKAWPLKAHSNVLDAFFVSNKMKALASFQDLYVGLEPFENRKRLFGGVLETTAPAVFGLLAAIELHPTNAKCGVFAPIGGFEAVTKSLEKLAHSLGVEIQTDCEVNSVTDDGVHFTIKGDAHSKFEAADLVIVNADLPYATKSLLGTTAKPQSIYDWDDKYLYSTGVIAFHWNLGIELTELNTHNVFLIAKDHQSMEDSWKTVRGETTEGFADVDEPFNFYVHRPKSTDTTAAPRGMDAILVLVPCPTLQRDVNLATLPRDEALEQYHKQFDKTYIDRVRAAVFHRLEVLGVDIKSLLLDEVVDTPVTYARQYNVGAGTPFGLSHGFGQLSLRRPSMSSSKHSNVLFCGASTRPGNGVPLVLIGAELVSKQALSRIKSLVLEENG